MNGLGGFLALYVLVMLVQTASNYISAYGACKAELYIGRDLKRAGTFDHLQTLSFSYFNQNKRRLCSCARHVRHRPHREHARMGPDGGRVVHRVSAVRNRDDVRPELEAGASA